MTTTVNALKKYIKNQIVEINIIEDFNDETTLEDVKLQLENNGYEAPSVSYYHEAIEIVGSNEFDDYTAFMEPLDFSNCENALACCELEANAVLREAYFILLDSEIKEYLKYA